MILPLTCHKMRVTDEPKLDVNKIHFFWQPTMCSGPGFLPACILWQILLNHIFHLLHYLSLFANIVLGASSPDKTNSEYDVAGLLKLQGSQRG